MKISTVIIAKDAGEKIGDCLKSISLSDEIIVVDNASSDNTAEIARKLGARIVFAPEKLTLNYTALRNLGLKEASGNWILYVDSDERVTPELWDEINQLISKSVSQYNAYAIPRRNFIFGKEFKYCGQWPDYQKRLFKKSELKGWKGDVHEEPSFSGKLGHLKNPLIHLKEDNMSDMIDKTNKWSEVEARLMFEAHHPPMNILRFATAAFREFWLRFVIQMAFLDGTEGIIYGLYQVYSRLISYAKLWEIQLKNESSNL